MTMWGRITIPRRKGQTDLGGRGSDSLGSARPRAALSQLALTKQSHLGFVDITVCEVLFKVKLGQLSMSTHLKTISTREVMDYLG